MMVIREARIGDLSAMLDIYNDSVRTTSATFDIEEQTLEQRANWFSHYGGQYPLLVAEIGNCVAGYASLSLYREKAAYQRTTESSVYIDEAYRGRGVGKALMVDVLKRAAELGYHTVIAGITEGNEVSKQLHASLGFEYVGCFREVGHKFGQWQDVHYYQYFCES